MFAEIQDIEAMLELQKTDLALLQANKQLKGLPQRAVILKMREKKAKITENREKVEELRAKAQKKVDLISAEDEKLKAKQEEIQSLIDNMKGDFRMVESRVKELDGCAKRRIVLGEDLGKALSELDKVKATADQLDTALAQVKEQEQAAIKSFQSEGGDLTNKIAKLEAMHAKQIAALPEELSSWYEKSATRNGGVAVGIFEEGRCSVCHMPIDDAHTLDLKRQAPLGECPFCKRILYVK